MSGGNYLVLEGGQKRASCVTEGSDMTSHVALQSKTS